MILHRISFGECWKKSRCEIAAAVLGAGALSAGASIYGSTTAAGVQKDALNKSMDFQNMLFNILRGNAQPFIDAGKNALDPLTKLITPGSNMTETLSQIPGFQFAQDWGQKAVQNLGSMRGAGGNVIKAGSEYATGLAQTGWSGIVNALQGLVNTGTSAVGALGGVGSSFGKMGADTFTGMGNAGAAGVMGAANGVGKFADSMSTAAILEKLTGKSGGGIYDAQTGAWPAGAGNAPSYPNPSGGSWFIE